MTWWQQILANLGFTLPAPSPVWVPTYEPTQYVTTTMGDGSQVKVPIAFDYLATADTADHLLGLYDPQGKVVAVPFEGDGGNNSASASMRELQWPNGVRIIAGLLAVFYTENPNDPAEADRLCKDTIKAHGAA